jgi:hypothetical protein
VDVVDIADRDARGGFKGASHLRSQLFEQSYLDYFVITDHFKILK